METLPLGKGGDVLTDLDDDSPFEDKDELLSLVVVLHPLVLCPGVDPRPNDHEADWETISVYLVPDGDGGVRPAWVGSSTHDLVGADLRRRWDDPQLRREGDHPVIYPGAGSHSGAFLPGDYVDLRRASRAAPDRRLAAARPPTAAAVDRGAGSGRVRDPVRRLRPR